MLGKLIKICHWIFNNNRKLKINISHIIIKANFMHNKCKNKRNSNKIFIGMPKNTNKLKDRNKEIKN